MVLNSFNTLSKKKKMVIPWCIISWYLLITIFISHFIYYFYLFQGTMVLLSVLTKTNRNKFFLIDIKLKLYISSLYI